MTTKSLTQKVREEWIDSQKPKELKERADEQYLKDRKFQKAKNPKGNYMVLQRGGEEIIYRETEKKGTYEFQIRRVRV